MAFGREAIDQNGPTRDFPDASLLTGLLANALGFRREEADRHQRLQDRLEYAVRIDREGTGLRDFQTAQLEKSDIGWTTRGIAEGRRGGAGTYASPHIRLRHYRADASLTIAITLQPADEAPTLQDCLLALDAPARPLFIGRKPCLPSGRLALGILETPSRLAALDIFPVPEGSSETPRYVLSPADAEHLPRGEVLYLTGRRDWIAGVHAGQERRVSVRVKGEAAR